MDKLCGVESLQVVCHRFSDGVEVVRCVLEFCKEIAEVEQSYSTSILRLLRSTSYTFHSNILVQWLGSEPYEEIGTVKHSWQKLGAELHKLADLHAEKARTYVDAVRKPLFEVLPQLEEARRVLKGRVQYLKSTLESAQKKHTRVLREKQKYFQLGDSYERLEQRIWELQQSAEEPNPRLKKLEAKLTSQYLELQSQEAVYESAHRELVDVQENFNRDVADLYNKIQVKELERVDTLKQSLQEFARTLSNTVPAYLESMQQIVFSVEQIDGPSDVESFVEAHTVLMTLPQPPPLERHQCREVSQPGSPVTRVPMRKEDYSPSLSTQRSLEESEESGSEETESESTRTDTGSSHSTGSPREEGGSDSREVGATQRKSGKPEEPTKHDSGSDHAGRTRAHTEISQLDPARAAATRQRSSSLKNTSGTTSAERPQLEERKEENVHKNVAKKEGEAKLAESQSHVASVIQRMEAKRTVESEEGSSPPNREVPTAVPRPPPAPKLMAHHRGRMTERPQLAEDPEKARQLIASQNAREKATSAGTEKLRTEATGPMSVAVTDNDTAKKPSKAIFRKPEKEEVGVKDMQRPRSSSTRIQPPGTKPSFVKEQTAAANSVGEASPGKFSDPQLLQLLSDLQQHAASSDYYGLLGVEPGASAADLARARRDKSRELHPDHFASNPEKRAQAEEQLVLINQVFQDVLKNEETRALYDQLCQFRKVYTKTLHQKRHSLETAEGKLVGLHRKMKRAQLPLPLLEELQLALKLIKTCLERAKPVQ